MARRQRAILAATAVLAILGACSKVQRGDLPEAPPPNAPKGMADGYTRQLFPSLQAVDAFCRANNVSASDAYNRHLIESCVVPSSHVEALLDPSVVNDPVKFAALEAHEDYHTRGFVHGPDGKGWFLPQAQPTDWAKAFQAQGLLSLGRTETAATTPPQTPQPMVQALRGAR